MISWTLIILLKENFAQREFEHLSHYQIAHQAHQGTNIHFAGKAGL